MSLVSGMLYLVWQARTSAVKKKYVVAERHLRDFRFDVTFDENSSGSSLCDGLTFPLCVAAISSISENAFLQPPETAVSDTESCGEKPVPFNQYPTCLPVAVHSGQLRSLWVLVLLWISICVTVEYVCVYKMAALDRSLPLLDVWEIYSVRIEWEYNTN